jgi:hypothetical protein
MPDAEKVQQSAEKLKKDCEYFKTVAKLAAAVPVFGWIVSAGAAAGGASCEEMAADLAAQNADLWSSLQSPDVRAAYDARLKRERELAAQGKPKPPQVVLDATPAQKKAYDAKYAAWLKAVEAWELRTAPPLVTPDEWQKMTPSEQAHWTRWVNQYAAAKTGLAPVLATLRIPKPPSQPVGRWSGLPWWGKAAIIFGGGLALREVISLRDGLKSRGR